MATKDVEQQKKDEPTIAPDPKKSEDTGIKTVNIPLSQSNSLQPEAGIQVPVGEDATKEVVKEDPYSHVVKVQNEIDGDVDGDGKVSKAKYEQLLNTFNEVLTSHNLDAVHVSVYKAKAGIA